MGVGGQRHAPVSLSPGKTRYPLYRRLDGPQGRSGRVRKISPPTWIRSPDRPSLSESLYQMSYSAPRVYIRARARTHTRAHTHTHTHGDLRVLLDVLLCTEVSSRSRLYVSLDPVKVCMQQLMTHPKHGKPSEVLGY